MIFDKGSEWNKWDLHLHTKASYDYKYKAEDAEKILCESLRYNDIKAVAITDHSKIDKAVISKLRSLAPDIIFFPGVELRVDKGANNLHVILIFSNEINLDILVNDFEAIMVRAKAKGTDSQETIYWTFEDVVEFAKNHNALISIHAGRKSNGIDQEISNMLPVKEAIKEEIADAIDFFEIGQVRDIDDYEEHVFKCIGRKPLIICSDCHNPNKYSPKEFLWIKGDLTFEGLKQCLYQPTERVFIGTIPPMLDRFHKNKQVNISRIEIKRNDYHNNDEIWFDCSLYLNYGMVAIIGNKGSGKSALSDIIGHLCKSENMRYASFLNDARFRKLPKNYADDYMATLTWADGVSCSQTLGAQDYGSLIEDVQYLPQQYIETICSDVEEKFQHEIDRVIFSYVDSSERRDAKNLDELVEYKSRQFSAKINELMIKLYEQNSYIIRLENKKTSKYKLAIENGAKKIKDALKRHEASKPKEIKEPNMKKEDKEYQISLEKLKCEIEEKEKVLVEENNKYVYNARLVDSAKLIMRKIELIETQISDINKEIFDFSIKYDTNIEELSLSIISSKVRFESLIARREEDNKKINNLLIGLKKELEKLNNEKEMLISSTNTEEKAYQKYLMDLETWEQKRLELIGDRYTDNTQRYFECELKYINDSLECDYRQAISKRNEILKEIYMTKKEIASVYEEIYAPIQGEIDKLLENFEDNIAVKVDFSASYSDLSEDILAFINQRYNGRFGRGKNSQQDIEMILKKTNFNDIESVKECLDSNSSAVLHII